MTQESKAINSQSSTGGRGSRKNGFQYAKESITFGEEHGQFTSKTEDQAQRLVSSCGYEKWKFFCYCVNFLKEKNSGEHFEKAGVVRSLWREWTVCLQCQEEGLNMRKCTNGKENGKSLVVCGEEEGAQGCSWNSERCCLLFRGMCLVQRKEFTESQ